jgi:hypothetical protein
MNLRPWQLWTPDGRPQPETPEILATLEAVPPLDPAHPQDNHLCIRALERHPENGWSLHGLEECLRRRGAAEEAGRVARRFREAWARADVELRGSCFCRTGL